MFSIMEKQKSTQQEQQLAQKYPERLYEAGDISKVEFTLASGKKASVDTLNIIPEKVTHKKPLLIIPSFTEGLVQVEEFASALSEELGAGVVAIGQYEREKKGRMTPKEALENQAAGVIAVIESKNLQMIPVDIVTSSMGALVFARAAQLAHERGWSCFDESQGAETILVSPAGVVEDDTTLKVAARFAKNGIDDAKSKPKEYWDMDSYEAGRKEPKIDFHKWQAEARLAAGYRIDFKLLSEFGIHPEIVTLPSDKLMGQEALGRSVVRLLDEGQVDSWSTPWSGDLVNPEKPQNANHNQRHNAHMVNENQAERAAKAVASKFRLAA